MPPVDESTGNTKQPCTYCDELMWVSDKKREMIKRDSSFELVCMDCIALREKVRSQLGLTNSPLFDVNTIDGSLEQVVDKCKEVQRSFEEEP
jgi:hypothetical protein